MLTRSSILLALAVGAAGCGGGGSSGSSTQGCPTGSCAATGPTISMDFSATGDFYAAPFPTDARNGSAGVADFPNPQENQLVASLLAMLAADAGGFGVTSGVFFRLSAPIDGSSLHSAGPGDVSATGSIGLIGIDPTSPDYLHRYPVSSRFLADAGPYGGTNLLAVLPLQGAPLRPSTRYAAFVMADVQGSGAPALAIPQAMTELVAGQQPAGLGDTGFASYQAAIKALQAASIDVSQVAGLAAYTTGTPEAALSKVVAAMNASPPTISAPWTANEVFATYCVYSTTIPMPEYQGGVPPYSSSGGGWVFDAAGNPVLQRMEEANYYVTIPRSTMPAAGYPVVVLSRTGAGGNRPLVDRGQAATNGGPAIVPGSGPALYYAAAGFAGSEIDGPLGGLRNTTNSNEDYTIFNVGNPPAMRDNIRQSAAELSLQAHILENLSVDVSGCPGAVAPGNMATFDVANMALMGHSMGSTISPLTLAVEPRFRAGLMSGAGGSSIENILYKQDPMPILGIAEVLIGIEGTGYSLTEQDPMLSLFQWAVEAADPPVYSRHITLEPESGPPRNILMMQGIVDHYIMPPIADATSLSLGLDLAGPELDDIPGQIYGLDPVGPLLPLGGRSHIALPATANQKSTTGTVLTAIVTQHPADGIEDGHEVVFETDPPKHEYRCFLMGLLTSSPPSVPALGSAFSPCQ